MNHAETRFNKIVAALEVVGIVGGLIFFALWFGFGFDQWSFSSPTICTADAKICPDGTAVGRVGPSCQFAPCPQVGP